MRILVVEDDDASRYLLSDYLGTWGHEVIQVKDGLEAWDMLQNEPINFVISEKSDFQSEMINLRKHCEPPFAHRACC